MMVRVLLCVAAAMCILNVNSFSQTDSVGNLVWLDIDEDGFQDPSEFGIPNVEIELYELLDTARFINAMLTDSNGNYSFDSLTEDNTYELRIDLKQAVFSKWNIKPTRVNASNLNFDSNGEDSYYPGWAVFRFTLSNSSQTYDFGLIDTRFKDVRVNVCENALGAGISSFDLSRVTSEILSGDPNFELRYYQTLFDLVNRQNEITSTIYNSQDALLYGLIECSDDSVSIGIESMVRINLNYIDSMDYIELTQEVCEGDTLNLEEWLVFYATDYDLVDTLRVFNSSVYSLSSEIVDLQNYIPNSYPDTLYFYVTTLNNLCYTDGRLILNSYVAPEINLGSHARICPTDTISLRRIRAGYDRNGLCMEIAWWTSVSGGEFIVDSTALLADLYVPTAEEVAQEYAELVFHVIDETCGREVKDTVIVEIFPFGLFLECKNDTINCRHSAANAATTSTHNRPIALRDCEPFDITLLKEREVYIGCDTPFVKYICRQWELTNKDERLICEDTIFVRSIAFDSISWPDSMVIFRCEINYARIRGTNRPTASAAGIPKAAGINLYPSEDLCGWYAIFWDEEFDGSCTGEVIVIKRTWEVKNTCTGEYGTFIQWIEITNTAGPVPILESIPHLSRTRNTYTVAMNVVDNCEVEISPIFRVNPICSGVRQVNFELMETGERGRLQRVEGLVNRWEFKDIPRMPYLEGGYNILVTAMDSCWHQDSTLYSFEMKDQTAPRLINNSLTQLTLSSDMELLPIEVFIEEIRDLCALDYELLKRDSWKEKLGLDNCPGFIDSVESVAELIKLDFERLIIQLLPDDELGQMYGQFLYDLYGDEEKSGRLLYESLRYDMLSYWVSNCRVDEHGAAILDIDELNQYYEDSVGSLDLITQLGGGWMPQTYICCSDGCDTVKVNSLAIDQWANVGLNWSEIEVVFQADYELVSTPSDIMMSCQSFEKHGIQQLIDEENYDALDRILGTFKFEDEELNFKFKDYFCDSRDTTIRELYFDHDDNELWREVTKEIFSLGSTDQELHHGYVKSNCPSLNLSQRYWYEIDECGEGEIIREFYIEVDCSSPNDEPILIHKQHIEISSYASCELDHDMFEFPPDAIVVGRFEYLPNGNVRTPIQITFVRPLFFERCNTFAEHYDDVVYPGQQEDQYRIIRTWTIIDWCSDSVLTDVQTIMFFDRNIGMTVRTSSPEDTTQENMEVGMESNHEDSLVVHVAPNPTYESIRLIVDAKQSGTVKLLLKDQLGQSIIDREIHLDVGQNEIKIESQELNGKFGLLIGQIIKNDSIDHFKILRLSGF